VLALLLLLLLRCVPSLLAPPPPLLLPAIMQAGGGSMALSVPLMQPICEINTHLCPHLLDILQDHVTVPVECLHTPEQLVVVTAVDQDL
jgi:hypothetical protein